jgi:hypothetical protein
MRRCLQSKGLEPPPFSRSPIKGIVFHPLMLRKVALFAQLSVSE